MQLWLWFYCEIIHVVYWYSGETYSILRTITFSDAQFILNVRRFIAKKADVLFKPMDQLVKKKPDPTDDEGKVKQSESPEHCLLL